MPNLPNLPRFIKKREAEFGIHFKKWWMNSGMVSGLYELKHTRGKNYLPFNEVKDHQIKGLRDAKKAIFYKAPDDSRSEKPGDYFGIRNGIGVIVIKYPSFFCIIDIDNFILEMNQSKKRKSLTSEHAKEIAMQVVEL